MSTGHVPIERPVFGFGCLSSSMCPTPSPHSRAPHARAALRLPSSNTNTWTPAPWRSWSRASAGQWLQPTRNRDKSGMHMVRVLREHGKLDLLKGLIQSRQVRLQCCKYRDSRSRTSSEKYSLLWPSKATILRIPRLPCQASVDAIKAAGGNGRLYPVGPAGSLAGQVCWPLRASLRRPLRRRLSYDDDRKQPVT